MNERRRPHDGHRGGPGGPRIQTGRDTQSRQSRREQWENAPVVQEVNRQLTPGTGGLAGLPADELVDAAEKLAIFLAKEVKLNTTQIHRFLAQVNRLSAELATDSQENKDRFVRERVVLLKPRLAYAAGQHDEVGPLAKVVVHLIDGVHNYEDYKWFARFVEAVVAYHRYHGGPEN